jgi:5-methyltetrahydropteroyltriglutamate--homocysteine methyltransferase
MLPMRTTPPFRADHVGSLLRPPALLAAREDFAAGKIDAARLREIEDQAITDAVAMQAGVGLQSATDGEFRRATWHMDFIYQIGGISKAPGNISVKFHNAAGDIEWTPAALHVDSRLRMDKTIFGDDFSYLQSAVPAGVMAKQTIPSPNMVHYRGGPASIDPKVYPDMEQFWADLAAAYADEVARLAALGCRYLQFDDTSLAYLNDPAQRADIAARGEDADHMHLRYIRQVNAALTDKPAGLTVTTHLCRGNFAPPGPPPAATTSSPRPCSVSWRWTGSSSNTTTLAPGVSSRCGSSRPTRWSCSAWSPPRPAPWKTPTCSSAASTRRPSTSRSTSSACPASAASPPPSRATS